MAHTEWESATASESVSGMKVYALKRYLAGSGQTTNCASRGVRQIVLEPRNYIDFVHEPIIAISESVLL